MTLILLLALAVAGGMALEARLHVLSKLAKDSNDSAE